MAHEIAYARWYLVLKTVESGYFAISFMERILVQSVAKERKKTQFLQRGFVIAQRAPKFGTRRVSRIETGNFLRRNINCAFFSQKIEKLRVGWLFWFSSSLPEKEKA